MYEARDGAKYSGYRDATLIAKDIRADIKAAIKSGELPAAIEHEGRTYPISYTIRTRKYAGGQSIDFTIHGAPDGWVKFNEDTASADEWNSSERRVRYWTLNANRVYAAAQRIHRAYNRSRTESMVDYFNETYYGTVEFEDERSAQFWAGEKARLAARKTQRAAVAA